MYLPHKLILLLITLLLRSTIFLNKYGVKSLTLSIKHLCNNNNIRKKLVIKPCVRVATIQFTINNTRMKMLWRETLVAVRRCFGLHLLITNKRRRHSTTAVGHRNGHGERSWRHRIVADRFTPKTRR